MPARKHARKDQPIDSISASVGEELAAMEAARERQRRNLEAVERRLKQELMESVVKQAEENRKRADAQRRAEAWAKVEPEYNALLAAICELEREILQLDYEIRTRYQGLPSEGREYALKALQVLISRRNSRMDDLQSKRRSGEQIKSLFG